MGRVVELLLSFVDSVLLPCYLCVCIPELVLKLVHGRGQIFKGNWLLVLCAHFEKEGQVGTQLEAFCLILIGITSYKDPVSMFTTVDVALVVLLGKELLVITNCACAFKGLGRIANVPVGEKVVVEMFFAGADNSTRLALKDLLDKTSDTLTVTAGNGAINGALNREIDR